MNKLIYILGIVIVIVITVIIIFSTQNKKTFESFNSSNNFNFFDPIIPTSINNLCNQKSAFISIEKDPTFLLITPMDNCNINLHLFKYDGQNIDMNTHINEATISNFGEIINNKIKTDDTVFIPAPLKIMNIRLDDLKSRGGLYYDHNNVITPINKISCNRFKLNNHTLDLIEPYANTRQQSDKLMLFKGNNGLIGEIHGYRDKDQKFVMEWICWRKNGKYLSYGTVMSNP